MSVRIFEDRTMLVQPGQRVGTGWIDIDSCRLGCRAPMSPEAVEKKHRRLLQQGDGQPWPPIVGHWRGDRFVVCDGRHEYLAALMLGRDRLFVAWLVDTEGLPDVGTAGGLCGLSLGAQPGA